MKYVMVGGGVHIQSCNICEMTPSVVNFGDVSIAIRTFHLVKQERHIREV